MFKSNGKLTLVFILVVGIVSLALLLPGYQVSDSVEAWAKQGQQATPTPLMAGDETIPPNTPLATLTPSQTLKPAPTLEAPTATWTPSAIPTVTPTTGADVSVSIPGLHGAETATPTSTPGCTPREDWTLIYTVQRDDALSTIAEKYGTWVDELAEANCITNKDVIVVGQELRVPGEAHPYEPEIPCVPWQLFTPIDGAIASVPADGTVTFHWIGPEAPLNLIRIHRPDGSIYEQLVELRQNDVVELNENLPAAGWYTWYVYPLDRNFVQIGCLEGGPWTFYKPESATVTPTSVPR
ncbi:MAG: LysM peptidoglycan-binding domain-containing protein [Anaerolineae bacterium]|nr:LysM peptidoglycan-binding domain-containing protein [Anaerolineae bacterium]